MSVSLDPLDALRDTSPPPGDIFTTGDLLSACGISWDAADIARFLDKCRRNDNNCLIWNGARSRGRGNTDWYGSFWVKGKMVRAHKFYAVAILGLRPRTGVHHLDHTCPNSLCVRHLQCVPISINLALRWIRVQVGLDFDKDRFSLAAIEEENRRLENWILQRGPSAFDPGDLASIRERWISEHNQFRFDLFDPRFWEEEGVASNQNLTQSLECVLPPVFEE